MSCPWKMTGSAHGEGRVKYVWMEQRDLVIAKRRETFEFGGWNPQGSNHLSAIHDSHCHYFSVFLPLALNLFPTHTHTHTHRHTHTQICGTEVWVGSVPAALADAWLNSPHIFHREVEIQGGQRNT